MEQGQKLKENKVQYQAVNLSKTQKRGLAHHQLHSHDDS